MHLTRNGVLRLTALAAALYVALGVVFANGFFTGTVFAADAILGTAWLSWVLLAVIVLGGVWQANQVPARGVHLQPGPRRSQGQVDDPKAWQFFLGNTWAAVLWLPIRFFVAQRWLASSEEKWRDEAWMDGGSALQQFWSNAVAQPEQGRTPITFDWYRDILQYMLDHEWYTWFAKMVAFGELAIGLGLLLGALVGVAAFFGALLNFTFLLAGASSANPVLFGLGILVVMGWKVAGHLGLDRFLLPALGTPWQSRDEIDGPYRAEPTGVPSRA